MSGRASDDRVREADAHVSADWQGLLTEDAAARQQAEDQFAPSGRPQLRHSARRLLGDLLRPHRRAIVGVLLVALVQVAATMAGPWLVGIAIDTRAARPPPAGDYASLDRRHGMCSWSCAVLSGWLRSVFVLRSGAIGQAILFDLRRRGFDHAQALSVSFHERFTSGRVISRLTSDVDTLTELLDAGLDGLLTAVLNIAAIAVLLFFLDVPLAAIALVSLIPLCLLFRWFSARAHRRVPAHPRDRGDADRQHRRDVQRHPRGAGVPPREAQRRDLRRAQRPLPRRQPRGRSACTRCSSRAPP